MATSPAQRERPALLTDEGTVSFHALRARADRLERGLGARLRGAGSPLPQGTPLVGVCMSRGPALVETLLAVLQAGGAYLPLDPAHPPARLADIVADARPSLIVTGPEQEALGREIAPSALRWTPDHRAPLDLALEAEIPAPREPLSRGAPAGERPFAVLYTSGSTGRPRGVCLPHRAAQNRFQWMWRAFPFTEEDVCCFKTPLSFVDSIWELFGALLQGVPVAVAPDGLERRPAQLLAFAARHRVSRLIVVPSLLRLLLPHLRPLSSAAHAPLTRALLWTCSGEPLPPALADALLSQRPADRLLNLYGSTEVMGDITAHVCRAGEDPSPIGRPIDNTTIELLDDAGAPVEVGERGAVFVRGANLSLGYLGRGVDSDAWVEDGQRYATGDLGRMVRDPIDGGLTLLYEGRRDRQVNLLGNRVDLAEIERALLRCEGVTDAVALAHEDAAGPALLGFVRPREGGSVDLDALRGACAQALPPYARPALYLVDRFPLLPNGKLDRQGLLALAGAPVLSREDPIEAAWRAFLPRAVFAEDADFFEAGGTSLLAVDLLRRLHEAGVTVSLERFYAAPSPGALRRAESPRAAPVVCAVRPLKQAGDALGTAALGLLADRFDEIDPLKLALDATRSDLHALFTSHLAACAAEGLSFVATDGRGELIGCVVAGDLARAHVMAEAGRFEVTPALRPLDAVMSALMDPWCHREPDPRPGEWVYVMLLAVTGLREVAWVARALEAAVIEEARARGCRGVVTINTHALTQEVSEELGYRTEARLDVRGFLHEGARPFAEVAQEGAELRLDVLRLFGGRVGHAAHEEDHP